MMVQSLNIDGYQPRIAIPRKKTLGKYGKSELKKWYCVAAACRIEGREWKLDLVFGSNFQFYLERCVTSAPFVP